MKKFSNLPKSAFTIFKTYGEMFSVGLPFNWSGIDFEGLKTKFKGEDLTLAPPTERELKEMLAGEIRWVYIEGGTVKAFVPNYIYSY